MSNKEEKPNSTLREYANYSDAGIKFALYILLGLFGGQWLDKRWEMKGLLTILGMFTGASLGMYTLYKNIFREEK
ncbi:MAG: AtpZ/AtpI family protein [Planctomycetota bacterium]